ncbi:hypothetical protein BXO88_12190 [Oribacterium sp. C9]|uniref:hypothetical protein n=1 Tax=Oribacterium sp. C9 TaxID=1943579 RepID=UPI000990008F|nr:hypothetical protein [Oribacterium sp. C9]OON85414.1 hypothetical protein BXO88_12190 [Oribacterium sp. C9]
MYRHIKSFLKIAGITLISAPAVLIALFIIMEVVGIHVNHSATDKQTAQLKEYVETHIEDADIIDVYSETGNTTGTSNHVDCLSRITFDTELLEPALTEILDEQYKYYELDRTEDAYTLTVVTEAPFWDNIEGH